MRTGIVLSGGGARGIAHLGVLQALEEKRGRPAIISGTSSGALIGALYASGKSPSEILTLIKSHAHSNLAAALFLPGGLFSSKGLQNLLETIIPIDNFEALSIPLFVTATDLISGTVIRCHKGKLHAALLGSAAIPGVFNPVPLDSYMLADGGIMDNLPVKCIHGLCEEIIGVHVNKFLLKKGGWNRSQVIERAFHLAISRNITESAALCDRVIEPDLSAYSIFDIKHADELFSIGYKSVF